MYVVTLSVFHNLAIWLLYVNKPEPGSEKSLFLWSGSSAKNRLFTADVQNDAPSPSRMHAVNCLVDDAMWNALSTL